MRCRLDTLGGQLLHEGGVLEDPSQLPSNPLEFLCREVDPGQARHISNVDVDSHGPIVGARNEPEEAAGRAI